MDTADTFSLLALFKMGGAFMWPLLAFSVATIAIALERAIYFLYHNLRVDDLRERVEEFVAADDLAGAEAFLEKLTRRRMGSRVLLALVQSARVKRRAGPSEHRLEKAAEAEAGSCVNALENSFNLLIALGSLSPLTGFLGTVSGMIGAFKSIAEATDVNAQIVAGGIYEALITTVFGLIIAIIAMVSHSLFSHISDKFAANIEEACTAIIAEIMDKAEAETSETSECNSAVSAESAR